MKDLFEKYDVAAPRYTSYPTVPYWDKTPGTAEWVKDIAKTAAAAETSWSVYLHLPFCESACAFCACNTIITHDHSVELAYAKAIQKELALYLQHVPQLKEKPLRQMHIGGGTPTFFSASNLDRILEPFYEQLRVEVDDLDASIEVNPRYVNNEQLRLLTGYGFRRISLGVQDFDSIVQEQIGRVQPLQMTEGLADEARGLGFESVNFDLIYGLPGQTPESMRRTADLTIDLKPDRIALFSLALVPWVTAAHERLAESAPKGAEKRKLYEICRDAFLGAGYMEIGMDHFALPNESLAVAAKAERLHRNFMGYTDVRTDVLLGFGASAISQSPGCYHQNVKEAAQYETAIGEGCFATLRGHLMTDEDKTRYGQILSLMTRFWTELEDEEQERDVQVFLRPLIEDGLVDIEGAVLRLKEAGRPFLRNACMAFDARMRRKMPETKIFSQSV